MSWAETQFNNNLDFGKGGAYATPKPYIESDKSSRTAALWEGISGVIQTAAEAYRRIKYNPQPVPYGGGTLPPDYPNYPNTNPDVPYYLGVERPNTGGPSLSLNNPMLIFGAIGIVLLFVLLRK